MVWILVFVVVIALYVLNAILAVLLTCLVYVGWRGFFRRA